MKAINKIIAVLLTIPLLAAPFAALADEQPAPTKPGVKPDPLTTCVVSGEKLGEMGKPYVFEYQGQEVKLCCESCKKDFDKNPKKYLKKIEDAQKNPPAAGKAKN